jgi:ankyrin repeat protein
MASGLGMAAAKMLTVTLLVSKGFAAEPYRSSDEEYKSLQRFAAPSNFYPDGNGGQLKLLINCVDRGDAAVLDRLLKAVPNFVNVSEHGSRSGPAHWAAFRGETNILAVLVKHGANLNKKDTNWKITPLHIARDAATAEFLLANGADIEAQETHAQTPLMWAARRGNIPVAEYLLKRGAKLDKKDESEKTAVALAQKWGHTNMVTFLVEKGATAPATDTKQGGVFEVTAGSFSDAPGHPFAESKLIHGAR